MKYSKPALIYEDQLTRLSGRGLGISDQNRALRWLQMVGYYRLSAYLYPFRNSAKDDNFRAGSSFESAVDIYKFDCELRLLIFQALDRIEIAMRAASTYELSHALGPFGYTISSNFTPYVAATKTRPESGLDFPEFIRTIERGERMSQETFVSHYRTVYLDEKYLPLWMATEVMSLGTLCRMLQNVSKSLRKKIAIRFDISHSQLTSWLHCLHYVRNVCAHHGRLWNREISLKPELRAEWKTLGIGRERLHCVLLVIDHLYNRIAPEGEWLNRLAGLFIRFPQIDYKAMGIPENWQELQPWKETAVVKSVHAVEAASNPSVSTL